MSDLYILIFKPNVKSVNKNVLTSTAVYLHLVREQEYIDHTYTQFCKWFTLCFITFLYLKISFYMTFTKPSDHELS